MLTPASVGHPSSATPQLPLAFLRQMTSSSELRSKIEANPVATLAAHGIHIDSASLPSQVSLPSQEILRLALLNYESSNADDAAIEKTEFAGFFGGLLS